MPTYTTTYSLGKPVVGADEDAWGDTLNTSLDAIDDILDGTTPVTGIDINSGTLDGVTIGGTTAGAGTFTTLTANTSITGTLATAAQPNVTSLGTLTSLTVSGDVSFGDNDKAIFGAGSDLQIYHDGNNSYISDQGTGNIILDADDSFQVKRGSNYSAYFDTNAEVTLYHNNAAKLATTATGIDVTGTAVTDGVTVAGNLSVDGGTIKLDGNYPTGTQNVALGDGALDDGSLSGNNNTALGSNALTLNGSGTQNVGVGTSSLYNTLGGSFNTATGVGTLYANTSGNNNTAFGNSALNSNTTASNNTAVGYQAAYNNTTGASNTAVGWKSLYSTTTGYDNSALGRDALGANTSGINNTALGWRSLYSNTTANNNTAVGYQALLDNTTGDDMVAVGYQALANNTTGQDNTGIGLQALTLNTTGNYNVAMGLQALRSNTTASNNTAVGYQAGYSKTVSDDNTFIGGGAGYSSTTGSKNTCVGAGSGYNLTTGYKNTILGRYNGNQGGLDIRTSSNNIVLSDGDGNPRQIIDSDGRAKFNTTAALGTGVLQVKLAGTNKAVGMRMRAENAGNWMLGFENSSGTVIGKIVGNASATAYETSSDYRLKENVVELTGATDRLKQIPVHRFNFINDPDDTVDGFLAHEVQAIVPEAISGTHNEVDDDGNPVYQGIDQAKLVPLLVATIKELEARITALEGA